MRSPQTPQRMRPVSRPFGDRLLTAWANRAQLHQEALTFLGSDDRLPRPWRLHLVVHSDPSKGWRSEALTERLSAPSLARDACCGGCCDSALVQVRRDGIKTVTVQDPVPRPADGCRLPRDLLEMLRVAEAPTAANVRFALCRCRLPGQRYPNEALSLSVCACATVNPMMA